MRVKVSDRNQIALPSKVRRELNIQPGDYLLVDIQDGIIVMMPAPPPGVDYLAGFHKEVWARINANEYIREERASWQDSSNE
jgi:AbrB family looped-hinge helix DNA binding protein